MNEPELIERLRTEATCRTSHPAEAAAALIEAASAVLLPRFNKYQVANMIAADVFEALTLSDALERGMLDGCGEMSEPAMTRLFVKQGSELVPLANQAAIGAAMLSAALVTLEGSHGTLGACAAIEAVAALARRGELLSGADGNGAA